MSKDTVEKNLTQKERHEARKARALDRQAARATRTPQQQLDRLDAKFGKGQGAKRERARLNAQIQGGGKSILRRSPAM